MDSKLNSDSAKHARDEVRQAAGGIKDGLVGAADEAKAKAAGQMAGVSRAVHAAADELGRELPQAAGYIHSVAERFEDASSALRDRSVGDFVSTFSGFARRQPAVAFAGSVLAGFALSRLLKSSAPPSQDRP
jgi:adenylosuccinate lyase